MIRSSKYIKNFDWLLFGVMLVIMTIGAFTIYSAAKSYGPNTFYFQKQLIWMVIGFCVFIAVYIVDYRLILRFANYFHGFAVILLVAVLFFGSGGPGSDVKRWLHVGGFFLQPSELAKLTLVLFFAAYFEKSKKLLTVSWINLLVPIGVTLVTFFLILRQPDLGTAGNLLFIAFILLFIAGLDRKLMILGSLFFVVSLPFVWGIVLKSYQKNRILTLLNPERDPLGKGYHIIQSKIAIGSGGLWGKGYLKGTQAHLNFLPARYTDFILSVFAEERGLIGCLILLALYVALLFLSLRNIIGIKNRSGIFLIVGLVSLLATQILINVAMVLGIFPVVGMPLPWMSYGGTALLADMSAIALILNVHMRHG